MSDLYRPVFHFTPPSMWMNDPNGLVYFDGEYHLFYQHHPHSTIWGPMHWGHAVSRDLVHWEHLPIALSPDDNGMIFSGSAVVDVHNTAGFGANAMVAIFTHHAEQKESQSLAYSTDRGRTWTKYAGNPVIPHQPHLKDFRDPKVFWYSDHWVMALAAKDKVLFFSSPNLKDWQLTGEFGNGFGSTEGVWETPDLFELTVESTAETRWALTVGVGDGAPAGGSGTQYFIGHFDGKTFTSENPKETILWMDYGADFYAPQSWNDEPHGRRILLGWMSNWQYARDVPAQEWRGAFNLLREVSLRKTKAGIRLAQQPTAETRVLRREAYHWYEQWVSPSKKLLQDLQADAVEVIAVVDIARSSGMFGFQFRKGTEEQTTVKCNLQTGTLLLDRTRSGQSHFAKGFAAMHSAKLSLELDTLYLHIFVDRSSVEVFAEDGLVCLSDLIHPSAESLQLECFAEDGSIHIRSLSVYPLGREK